MGHHQRRALEVGHQILERGERRHVEIVGWLVEDHEVGAAREDLGEGGARAFAARERADRLALLVVAEEEAFEVAADVERLAADVDPRAAVGDVLEDALVVVEVLPVLIEVRDARVLADDDLASGRREVTEDRADQRRLSGPVSADDADPLAGHEGEIQA